MSEERIASRINIKYSPATDGAREQKEIPLKLLVVGDFSAGSNPTRLSGRKALSIDKYNFDERLAAQDIELNLSVPDRVSSEEGASLRCNLKIRGMKDFSPDSVVQQVDGLRQLIELRGILEKLKQQYINEEDFRVALRSILKDPETTRAVLAELKMRTGDT